MKYKEKRPESQGTAPNGKKPVSPVHIGVGALLAGVGFAAGTLAYAWLATHPPRRRVVMPDDTGAMEFEEIGFLARDGVRLSGWFAPAVEARGGIIFCHGHPANRLETLPWARLLHAVGYHVLLFDFRAMGESEGELTSIGSLEVNDLLGATDYLTSRPEMEGLSLGVYGISMGGAVSIMAAAQDERIRAVATHGAYADLERAIRQRGRLVAGPFGPALSKPVTWWGKRWIDVHPRTVSPLEVICKIAPRPLLLMHGAKDRIVHPEDARALYQAAGFPKAIHILPASWHVRISREELPEYQQTLCDFFRQAL